MLVSECSLGLKALGTAPLPDSCGSRLSMVVQVTFFSVFQEWRESQDVKGLGRKWLRLCTFSFSQTLQAKVPNRVP